jgi:hypothetical protein
VAGIEKRPQHLNKLYDLKLQIIGGWLTNKKASDLQCNSMTIEFKSLVAKQHK